ncbi:MAG: hypothetical protein FP814_02295 [Desulfobacterium sp.]|nr:hypothetical protein [Desulfobacterium sp.]
MGGTPDAPVNIEAVVARVLSEDEMAKVKELIKDPSIKQTIDDDSYSPLGFQAFSGRDIYLCRLIPSWIILHSLQLPSKAIN